MPDPEKITPMMKQYLQAKAETPPGSILLFRLGDFYEIFFEDANRAAPLLEVALTRRAGYPMCGVPHHAINAYLPKLLSAGIKVAIAEQLEDPRFAKGIVKRAVTRILTPGAILDSNFLKPSVSNFLCSLFMEKKRYGLAWLDISTAEFKTCELDSIAALEDELQKLQPKECLITQSQYERWSETKQFPAPSHSLLWTPVDDWIFSTENASDCLKRHFHVLALDAFGLRSAPLATRAAGSVLYYAGENLHHNTGHIRSLQYSDCSGFLGLDPICQRNLELVESFHGGNREGTLLQILDQTSTAMGSRLMRSCILQPLRNHDEIIERQDAVGFLRDEPLTLAEIRESLRAVRDIERLTAKLHGGAFNARDMQMLGNSIEVLPAIRSLLEGCDLPLIGRIRESIRPSPGLAERIACAIADTPPISIADGGMIRTGFHAGLDELRSAAANGKQWVAQLQASEQERTGIKSLKVNYNKVFGYYIEVSKSNLAHVPENYLRKQTLANGERFITPELKEMESKILGAEERAKTLEKQIFDELCDFARTFTENIQNAAKAVALLDVLGALAECASKHHYCRPHIADDDVLRILGGRHPVLEPKMDAERFVPNDTFLDGKDNRMMIITGPNMAGKSTYIRQTALLVIMAQMGSFIPADEAWIGIADRIFTRVGAMDDISRGQSTFMVEMLETANILHHATSKSLVILDEIGRGTSTFDGLSIAWAVAEFLLNNPHCRTQFATHYHELTELAMTREGVKNYNIAVREYGDQVIFLRQIIPGAADKSYGIHVAKLAGLPDPVILRARQLLENLENNAIGEAGMPALMKAREPRGTYRAVRPHPPVRGKDAGENGEKASASPIQLSLFD